MRNQQFDENPYSQSSILTKISAGIYNALFIWGALLVVIYGIKLVSAILRPRVFPRLATSGKIVPIVKKEPSQKYLSNSKDNPKNLEQSLNEAIKGNNALIERDYQTAIRHFAKAKTVIKNFLGGKTEYLNQYINILLKLAECYLNAPEGDLKKVSENLLEIIQFFSWGIDSLEEAAEYNLSNFGHSGNKLSKYLIFYLIKNGKPELAQKQAVNLLNNRYTHCLEATSPSNTFKTLIYSLPGIGPYIIKVDPRKKVVQFNKELAEAESFRSVAKNLNIMPEVYGKEAHYSGIFDYVDFILNVLEKKGINAETKVLLGLFHKLHEISALQVENRTRLLKACFQILSLLKNQNIRLYEEHLMFFFREVEHVLDLFAREKFFKLKYASEYDSYYECFATQLQTLNIFENNLDKRILQTSKMFFLYPLLMIAAWEYITSVKNMEPSELYWQKSMLMDEIKKIQYGKKGSLHVIPSKIQGKLKDIKNPKPVVNTVLNDDRLSQEPVVATSTDKAKPQENVGKPTMLSSNAVSASVTVKKINQRKPKARKIADAKIQKKPDIKEEIKKIAPLPENNGPVAKKISPYYKHVLQVVIKHAKEGKPDFYARQKQDAVPIPKAKKGNPAERKAKVMTLGALHAYLKTIQGVENISNDLNSSVSEVAASDSTNELPVTDSLAKNSETPLNERIKAFEEGESYKYYMREFMCLQVNLRVLLDQEQLDNKFELVDIRNAISVFNTKINKTIIPEYVAIHKIQQDLAKCHNINSTFVLPPLDVNMLGNGSVGQLLAIVESTTKLSLRLRHEHSLLLDFYALWWSLRESTHEKDFTSNMFQLTRLLSYIGTEIMGVQTMIRDFLRKYPQTVPVYTKSVNQYRLYQQNSDQRTGYIDTTQNGGVGAMEYYPHTASYNQ